VLDPKEPMSIGAMVGPEAFMEVKYLAHAKQMQALELIPQLSAEFKQTFGRDSGGLVRTYRAEDAETMIVAMGSVLGTIKDVVDDMREQGHKIGVLGIVSYRPFPLKEVRAALVNCKRFLVLEKSLAVGMGGIVATDVRMAVSGTGLKGYTAIAGLGGRTISKASLQNLFLQAERENLEPVTFVDLDWDSVNKQLERERLNRRSGPIAENILHDKGMLSAAKFG
jgi:pyruvate ferredoxin oxidoreductase alpha subunit